METIRVEDVPIAASPRMRAEAERWRLLGRRPTLIETPAPGQESVWDYPRPPALQRVLDRVTIEFGGSVIASTQNALRVCETASPPTYYVPRADFVDAVLVEAPGRSLCEWKGEARYWSLAHGEVVATGAGWSYEHPTPEYSLLAGAVAVYPSIARCTVAGMVAKAQPGGFYGGWITPNLTGPFKGVPGSTGW